VTRQGRPGQRGLAEVARRGACTFWSRQGAANEGVLLSVCAVECRAVGALSRVCMCGADAGIAAVLSLLYPSGSFASSLHLMLRLCKPFAKSWDFRHTNTHCRGNSTPARRSMIGRHKSWGKHTEGASCQRQKQRAPAVNSNKRRGKSSTQGHQHTAVTPSRCQQVRQTQRGCTHVLAPTPTHTLLNTHANRHMRCKHNPTATSPVSGRRSAQSRAPPRGP
jgi:hypothetical protein